MLKGKTINDTRSAKASPVLAAVAALAVAGLPARAQPAGTPPVAPPLVQPASQERHPGQIIFEQLVTPDITAATRFYGSLFGWTFQPMQFGATEVAEAMADGHPVAVLVARPMPHGDRPQSTWLTFISTPDVNTVTHLAASNGGKVMFVPKDVPDLGREAVLVDPQGAVFAALTSSSGDPPDVLPPPGGWIWSSLVTTDPDTDAAFYQKLFGYEVFEAGDGKDAEHMILASGNYARASINPLPASRAKAKPLWVNFVRVDDADAMAAKVQSLGGRVLLPPQVDRHGGKIAIVEDPLGAPFGLMEWSEDAAAGAAK